MPNKEMDEQIKARITRIEDRLCVLEAVSGIDAARTAVVPPTPPPTPRPPPVPLSPVASTRRKAESVAATRPVKRAVDLERFFGVAVLGRVGVAAVLLAAAYFAQLAYSEMSDVLKVLSIYGLSAAFVGVGWFVRTRAADKYVALLWGGAAASAYLAGVAAYLRYDLVGPWVALGLLVGASALGQALARRLKHEWLASTALVGAFGAPLLVAPTLDHGTFLVAYLLLLHAWSAFSETRCSWRSARFVGVFGTLGVGGLWLASYGALDAPTYLIVNAYLLGLVAPEILSLLRSRAVPIERRALLLGLIAIGEGGLWAATLIPTTIALPAFGWIAGAAWIGAGLGLRNPAARAGGAEVASGLVTIGGLLVTLGCLAAPEVVGAEGAAAQWWMCSTLVLASLGMLGLRRIGGVGDLAASVSAILAACAAPFGSDPQTSLILAPLCALPALALVFTGRNPLSRIVGVGAGLLSITAGTIRGAALGDDWLAVALAGGAAWSALTLWVGAGRKQIEILVTATVGLALLAVLWFAFAFIGPLSALETHLVGPGTLAGLALVLVTGWAVLRDEHPRSAVAPPLWTVALVVALAVGHREVVAAVKDLALPARDAAHVAYLAAAGSAITLLGVRRRVVGVEAAGIVVVLAGCLKLLLDADRVGSSGWALPEVALAAGGIVLASLLVRSRKLASVVANIGIPVLAVCWALLALWGRFPVDAVLVNPRFAAGLVVLGAAAWVHGLRPDRDKAWPLLLAVGGALGYVVGLAEVLEAVKGTSGAWGDVWVSVYTTLYSAGLLVVGFVRRDRRLRYPALVGFGVVILKVGLHDLSGASLPMRILVTGILGLVLLAAAYAYARRTGTDSDDERLQRSGASDVPAGTP